MKHTYIYCSVLNCGKLFMIAASVVLCTLFPLSVSAQTLLEEACSPLLKLSSSRYGGLQSNRYSCNIKFAPSLLVAMPQNCEAKQSLLHGTAQINHLQMSAVIVYPVGASIQDVQQQVVRRQQGPPVIDGSNPGPENPGLNLPLSDTDLYLLLFLMTYIVLMRKHYTKYLSPTQKC